MESSRENSSAYMEMASSGSVSTLMTSVMEFGNTITPEPIQFATHTFIVWECVATALLTIEMAYVSDLSSIPFAETLL